MILGFLAIAQLLMALAAGDRAGVGATTEGACTIRQTATATALVHAARKPFRLSQRLETSKAGQMSTQKASMTTLAR